MHDEAPSPNDEVSTAEAAPSPGFNIQDYVAAPAGHRRLRRLPHLVRLAVAIVWRAAPREFGLSAGVQTINGAALAVQLLVVRQLLHNLLTGAPFSRILP